MRSNGLALLTKIIGWDFENQKNSCNVWKLGECHAGKQRNCKSATTGRGVGGCVDFSISEGSSDIPACKCGTKRRSWVMCDSCIMITCVLESCGKHHAQRWLLKRILQTLCRWMLTPSTVNVAKGRVKARTKSDRNKHYGQGRGEQPIKQRHFHGYCNKCGTDTRNQTAEARTISSMARVTNVEHMDTTKFTVLLRRCHKWNPKQWSTMVRKP